MNLGFWIAWFQYQKLKIFPFEYLMWKQRILPWEGFSPSLQAWFEGFVLDHGLKWKVLKWGINWRRILEAGEGGWIIINDGISTTLNKKNKTLQHVPLPIWFLSFFFANFLLVSMFLLLDWRAVYHIFIALFQRKQLVPHGPNYGRKERSRTIL